jgi:hypothetical protein
MRPDGEIIEKRQSLSRRDLDVLSTANQDAAIQVEAAAQLS